MIQIFLKVCQIFFCIIADKNFSENADIPDDPTVAFEQNAMKITRINAVAQVKSMVGLVDEIAANALKSMVAGEELNTKAPLGVSMKMAK